MQDIVSAPRPCSPPVRRVTATEDEKENAMEYGLPSSHALNTVCLMGYAPALIWFGEAWKELLANAVSDQCRYLLHYVLTYGEHDSVVVAAGLSLAFLLVMLVGIGELEFLLRQLFSVDLLKYADDLVYLIGSKDIFGYAQLDRCCCWNWFWHCHPCILVGCPWPCWCLHCLWEKWYSHTPKCLRAANFGGM